MLLGEYIADYTVNGRLPVRWGNRSPLYAPQGCYPCAGTDSWVAITVRDEADWKGLCKAMGRPDLADDPAYQGVTERAKRHDEIDGTIAAWTASRSRLEAMEELQRAGVPAGALLTPEEVLRDPQFAHREHFETGEHPEGGRTLYGDYGFKLRTTPPRPRKPAPCFGEHTETILKAVLGLSAEQVATLYEAGTVAREPVR